MRGLFFNLFMIHFQGSVKYGFDVDFSPLLDGYLHFSTSLKIYPVLGKFNQYHA